MLEYWKKINKSNKYSIKLIKLVSDRTTQIALNPELFKRTKFNNMHVSSMKNYSIYYRVTEKEIIITAFWDNRQDPKKLLSHLKYKISK